MRTIKFRARSLILENWVKGSYVKINDRAYIVTEEGLQCPVKEETVGMYIGLTDKNKVEIYEGDIILTQIGETYSDQTVIKSVMTNNCGDCSWIWGWDVPTYEEDIKECCTVIGNVWENPELLTQS